MKGKREEEGVYGSKKLGVKGCVERYNGSTIKTEKRKKSRRIPGRKDLSDEKKKGCKRNDQAEGEMGRSDVKKAGSGSSFSWLFPGIADERM